MNIPIEIANKVVGIINSKVDRKELSKGYYVWLESNGKYFKIMFLDEPIWESRKNKIKNQQLLQEYIEDQIKKIFP